MTGRGTWKMAAWVAIGATRKGAIVSLTIQNHGPLILATNYWEGEFARTGKLFLTNNAGAFRLLVPPAEEQAIAEMATAKRVIVSRGPWPETGQADAFEILFDDETESPYAVHLTLVAVDRVPTDSDALKQWVFTAWTSPRRGKPHKALERPAFYRRVEKLPCLKPLS
jgi:hypothetical protein